MTAVVEDIPVVVLKEVCDLFEKLIIYFVFRVKEDSSRIVQQNYALSSQYESLDTDDLYTKYKVGFIRREM